MNYYDNHIVLVFMSCTNIELVYIECSTLITFAHYVFYVTWLSLYALCNHTVLTFIVSDYWVCMHRILDFIHFKYFGMFYYDFVVGCVCVCFYYLIWVCVWVFLFTILLHCLIFNGGSVPVDCIYLHYDCEWVAVTLPIYALCLLSRYQSDFW